MAENSNRKYLGREEINIKKYLYAIRPLMCALWVDKFRTQPPVVYEELMNEVIKSSEVIAEINELVRRKQALKESDMISNNEILDNWIEQTFAYLKSLVPEKDEPVCWDKFDAAFKEIIGFKG